MDLDSRSPMHMNLLERIGPFWFDLIVQSRIVYSTAKAVTNGAIAGLISAIIMGVIAYLLPGNASGSQGPFFVAMVGTGESATIEGWVLNIAAGLVLGSIFGTITTKISKLRANKLPKSVGLGSAGGIVIWFALFLPVSILSKILTLSTSNLSFFAETLGLNLIFGVLMGSIVGFLFLRSRAYRCEECGAVFSSREAVMEHARAHVEPESRFKCISCGAIFRTEAEMADHAKTHMDRVSIRV
jgi:uncharacterized C2H2 Zn-finger protein